MKRFNFAVLAAAAMLLAACGPKTPKVDLAAEEKAVREVSMHWLDLAKAKDAVGEAGLFAADGIAYRLHREPAVGPAGYQAYATKNYTDNPKVSFSWATTSVTVAASGELAVETGTYHDSALGMKGDREDMGNYVTVYKKVNGAWKVAEDISTSSMPEATPAKATPAKAGSKKTPAKAPAKTPPKAPVKKK
jgi:uncharacterized protein (TIGR02246 family)